MEPNTLQDVCDEQSQMKKKVVTQEVFEIQNEFGEKRQQKPGLVQRESVSGKDALVENIKSISLSNYWPSITSSGQKVHVDRHIPDVKSEKKILLPVNPQSQMQLVKYLPINVKLSGQLLNSPCTAPNTSWSRSPQGSLVETLSTTSLTPKSEVDSKVVCTSYPGSPRMRKRYTPKRRYLKAGMKRILVEQDRQSEKVKPKRQLSNKQAKKEQIKKKILEEQKKLSDNSLVGKDAKSDKRNVGKGKEHSLTKTLVRKTTSVTPSSKETPAKAAMCVFVRAYSRVEAKSNRSSPVPSDSVEGEGSESLKICCQQQVASGGGLVSESS